LNKQKQVLVQFYCIIIVKAGYKMRDEILRQILVIVEK